MRFTFMPERHKKLDKIYETLVFKDEKRYCSVPNSCPWKSIPVLAGAARS